uniref:Nuclear/hormone receptor activator site AF-1 domain-containing protein n=1 Tax=Vombatus ursinus TaxID=29139 RepID=A0A4X2JUI2_VOMUR
MYGNYSHFMKFPAGFGSSLSHTNSPSMSPSPALTTGKSTDSHSTYIEAPVSVPRTLASPLSAVGSPLNALGSSYRVITSAIGPHSLSLATSPGVNMVGPPNSQVGIEFSLWTSSLFI